jgi:MFS-type transporter involved in bile tolerance (Atg22 family)
VSALIAPVLGAIADYTVSTSSKFAGIAGPLLFGVVSQVAGQSCLSIVSLIVFFTVGGLLLIRVAQATTAWQ